MHIIFVFILFALSLAHNLTAANQQLELAAPFTDNAILQRETLVLVLGWDVPGSKVTVQFSGQTKSTVADKNGDWMVDPLKASHTLRPADRRAVIFPCKLRNKNCLR